MNLLINGGKDDYIRFAENNAIKVTLKKILVKDYRGKIQKLSKTSIILNLNE
jgi:hypothetical protein